MTVKMRKTEARQGERRTDQEKVFVWSMIIGFISLGGVTAAAILLTPLFGS
ncbi:MAG: hypothetical protein ACOC0V_01710 [Oceanicaulis sp.]